jgi:hypothetical protein
MARLWCKDVTLPIERWQDYRVKMLLHVRQLWCE